MSSRDRCDAYVDTECECRMVHDIGTPSESESESESSEWLTARAGLDTGPPSCAPSKPW